MRQSQIDYENRRRLKPDYGTYMSWQAMKGRCYNPNNIGYRYYGGRGIGVCERWRDSFSNFLADMGLRPVGLTLDRIDNESNYEPGNCRWATWDVQTANKRAEQYTRPTKRSKSGVLGVHPSTSRYRKPWQARIEIKGKQYHLGHFWSQDDAVKALDDFRVNHGLMPVGGTHV